MLKLKKLELHGFKSFCEREHFQFNGGGITAIVGPNGCGKSNVSDAISWVLGERSAKTLRGSQMRDVIFNGSRDRKPSGLATVSLTLVDPDAFLARSGIGEALNGTLGHSGPTPSEITVTRRLFRSGESEYLMNGRSCRLRDIQDLFMGTGLGPEHYAIIEQGRIGQILSSRPSDRRAFLEEAAGITKFKSKKRLAELKLESARQNLNRVNDILQEVSRQVNSLKRQASRARRYEELRTELGGALAVLLSSRYQGMRRQLNEAGSTMETAEAEYRDKTAQVRALEAGLAANRRQEQSLEADLERLRHELSELTVTIERLRSRIGQQAGMAEENLKHKQQAEGEIVLLNERLEALSQEVKVEEAAVESVVSQSTQVRERLLQKNAELEAQHQALAEREQTRENSRQSVLSMLGEISTLRNQLAKIEEFLAGNERHVVRVREEESGADKELAELAQTRLALSDKVDGYQRQIDQLQQDRNRLEQQIAELKQQAQQRRSESDRLRQDLSKVTARRDSLEEILSHHAYTTETVKNLFSTIGRNPVEGFEPIGILADFVEVDPRYEKATEEFLREELEFVVVKNWEQARQGIQVLRTDLQGFATFLVHPDTPVTEEVPALGPETGVAGRLANFIQLTNGLSGSASTLLPRLRTCYLVSDEEAARRLALQYPDLCFLLSNGVYYQGHTLSGGKKSSAGPLALKRELRELRPWITKLEQDLETASTAGAQAEQQIAESSAELEQVRARLQELEKSALAVEHEERQLNDRAERAQRRLTVARLEIERLGHEEQRASQEREQHQSSIEQRETERAQAEEVLQQLKSQIETAQQARARLAEEHTALRTELATLEERQKSAVASLQRVRQQGREQEERRDRISAQIGEWETERRRLLSDNEQLERQIGEFVTRHDSLEQQVAQSAEQLDELRSRIAEIEEDLRTTREILDSARERRSAVELQLVQLRSDIKHLSETCERELGATLEEVAARHPEPPPPEQLAEVEEQVTQLRQKIESLGPVNVLALEEYQESQQRLEFLETQRNDLMDSIRDTQQAINEIDTVSRKQFQIALDEINRNFSEMFRTLFGGGMAEMRLTDEENPAESGVDIVASPPGKRLQNVALLSGGEKSLTAIALLMATFQYKPSPFCILDEVDAALDEPNIFRFRRLLEKMSGQSQFIIITHSKTTMEAAQTLYGITMAEPGVSRLVSVRMADHMVAERDAVSAA